MHPVDKVCYYSNSNQTIVSVKHYDLLIAKPTSYDDDFNEEGNSYHGDSLSFTFFYRMHKVGVNLLQKENTLECTG